MAISFDRKDPPDLLDPRVVPAFMEFNFVTQGDRMYIEWNVTEGMRVNGQDEKGQLPYVLRNLISAEDARVFAQTLLDVAAIADDLQNGGPGRLPPGSLPL